MNLQNNHEMRGKKLSIIQQLWQQHLVQYSDSNSPETQTLTKYSNKPIIINSNATSMSTSDDATSGDKGRYVQVTSMIRLPSVPDDEEDTKDDNDNSAAADKIDEDNETEEARDYSKFNPTQEQTTEVINSILEFILPFAKSNSYDLN